MTATPEWYNARFFRLPRKGREQRQLESRYNSRLVAIIPCFFLECNRGGREKGDVSRETLGSLPRPGGGQEYTVRTDETLRWGDFLIGQKVTKDPPKAGSSPALWNPPRRSGMGLHRSTCDPGPVGSHGWIGCYMVCTCFYDKSHFYPRVSLWYAAVPGCRKPGPLHHHAPAQEERSRYSNSGGHQRQRRRE